MDWEEEVSEELWGDEVEEEEPALSISKFEADKNLEIAGSLVDDPEDQISVARNESLLLNDNVHQMIMEVVEETKIPFKLADFQLISLHTLGNQKNLILISPTGSGKMLVVLLGTLLMRKVLRVKGGVSVGTQPLSIIMEDKLKDKTVPTAVITMSGDIKQNVEDTGEASLSSPEEELLQGNFPCIIGHPESWSSETGQGLLRNLQKRKMILLNFVDELHQGLDDHWKCIR